MMYSVFSWSILIVAASVPTVIGKAVDGMKTKPTVHIAFVLLARLHLLNEKVCAKQHSEKKEGFDYSCITGQPSQALHIHIPDVPVPEIGIYQKDLDMLQSL